MKAKDPDDHFRPLTKAEQERNWNTAQRERKRVMRRLVKLLRPLVKTDPLIPAICEHLATDCEEYRLGYARARTPRPVQLRNSMHNQMLTAGIDLLQHLGRSRKLKTPATILHEHQANPAAKRPVTRFHKEQATAQGQPACSKAGAWKDGRHFHIQEAKKDQRQWEWQRERQHNGRDDGRRFLRRGVRRFAADPRGKQECIRQHGCDHNGCPRRRGGEKTRSDSAGLALAVVTATAGWRNAMHI